MENNKNQNRKQQITAPLDPISKVILHEDIPVFQSASSTYITVKINGKNYNIATNVQAFPVGAIYTEITGTNPGTTFGYGTWVAFGSGQVLVGFASGDANFGTVLATGGEKTHLLTTAEMPAHTHTVPSGGNGGSSTTAAGATQNSTIINTSSTGGGGAHNNLQPFVVVYFWQRTA